MRTELQRQASRLNGAKSRGPTTAASKRRSSQNACRHGLYSCQVLDKVLAVALPAAHAPDPQFATIAEAAFHYAHLEFMQVAALEARILNEEIDRQRLLHPDQPCRSLYGLAFRHLCDETGAMVALYRLQFAAARRLERAIQRLEEQNAGETEFCGMNPTLPELFGDKEVETPVAAAGQTSSCETNLTPPETTAATHGANSGRPAHETRFCGTNLTAPIHAARAASSGARRKTPLRGRIRRLPPLSSKSAIPRAAAHQSGRNGRPGS